MYGGVLYYEHRISTVDLWAPYELRIRIRMIMSGVEDPPAAGCPLEPQTGGVGSACI